MMPKYVVDGGGSSCSRKRALSGSLVLWQGAPEILRTVCRAKSFGWSKIRSWPWTDCGRSSRTGRSGEKLAPLVSLGY